MIDNLREIIDISCELTDKCWEMNDIQQEMIDTFGKRLFGIGSRNEQSPTNKIPLLPY
jgi:hypothetical protein